MQGTHRGRLFGCTEWETFPSINKMVLKACASAAQLVKSSLPNKSDGHKALPQKDPSSMDPL